MGTRPPHPWPSQTGFVLFDLTFNGARANQPTFFAEFVILHPVLMVFKIAGMVG